MCAQQTVSFTVSTSVPGAVFTVDGTTYTSVAQFQWPAGSRHVVSYFISPPPTSAVVPTLNGVITPLQLSLDGTMLYTFGGWMDNTGFLSPTGDPTQIVTADGSITSLTAQLTLSYRILLSFSVSPTNTAPPACEAPYETPPTGFFAGYVYVNSVCYWNSAVIFAPAGSTVLLNAFPLPGFVFLGWSGNLGSNSAYLRSYVLNGAVEIAPMFSPGKRVRVETNPLGLDVLIDRTQTQTLAFQATGNTCPSGESQPIAVATYELPLCFGDFDFAPGSSHLIAAASPEKDINGNLWVFDSWTSASGQSGQTENSVYVTNNQTANPDQVIVKFDPGVQASFVTVPAGLPLSIDGRSNWPGYNFVWALGSTHTVAASAQEADTSGRQYTFSGWSNGGGASQTVTMVQSPATSGFRMTANYAELSRVVVQSVPAGQTIQVDGAPCVTPCNIDRANGTQIHVTAATSIPVATGARLDFGSWSDGGAADHIYTISSNLQTLTATYNTLYQLSASGSPGNGASFAFNPTSPDMFYPANTNVTVTAKALNGFRFVRWEGDLSGTYPSGSLSMGGPHAVLAELVTVPFIEPLGVENGAGSTPDAVVAPGSIAMILGQSLAPSTVVGPVNPLAQTIDNVTVMVGDQLLPLFSVTPQQITVLLPSSLSPGNYTLQVQSPGQPVVSADFTVARDAPGVFTNPSNSKTYLLGLHEDGTLITATKPAVQGEQIIFFGTGFGPYNTPVVDGFFPPNPPPAVADPISILAAGLTFQPDSAVAAPGYTGLVAVKFTITNAMPAGQDVNLQVEINGHLSNTVVLPMQ